MSTDTSKETPYYVLLEDNKKIKPSVLPLASGQECQAIYGFSGQEAYQTFLAQSSRELTPYPLVKTYLTSLMDSAGESMTMVVLDASSEQEPLLNAVKVKTVFEAHQKKTPELQSEFSLVFDSTLKAYRVEEHEPKFDPRSAYHLPI